jgi:hypothetical protein
VRRLYFSNHLSDFWIDRRPTFADAFNRSPPTVILRGNRHFAEGPAVQLVNTRTGALVEPVLVDGDTGKPITGRDFLALSRRLQSLPRRRQARP